MEYGLEKYFGESARLAVAKAVSTERGGISALVGRWDETFRLKHFSFPDLGTYEEFQRTRDILNSNFRMSHLFGEARIANAYLHLLGARASLDTMRYAEALQGFDDLQSDVQRDFYWPRCLTGTVNPTWVRDARRKIFPNTVGLSAPEVNGVISIIHEVYYAKIMLFTTD